MNQEARRALILDTIREEEPTFFRLLEIVYQQHYTGRIFLDCAEGIPRVVSFPQEMQIQLAPPPRS